MALTQVDTYTVTKNGAYDKTVKNETQIKINEDTINVVKPCDLTFDPADQDSVPVSKVIFSCGLSIIMATSDIN